MCGINPARFLRGLRMKCFIGGLVLSLLVPGESAADTLTIDVLNASYTTVVSNQAWINGAGQDITRSRTTVGYSPFRDALNIIDGVESMAAADLFGVELYTQAFPEGYPDVDGRSQASARSSLQFAPTETGIAPISVELAAQFRGLLYSSTSISLIDMTTDELLWSYGRGVAPESSSPPPFVTPIDYSAFADTIGPCFTRCFGEDLIRTQIATLSMPTLLDATHLYALNVFAYTSADKDNEYFRATVSGVHTVPEPMSIALLASGLVCAAVARRRTRDRSTK
jgi:hypothetical protein